MVVNITLSDTLNLIIDDTGKQTIVWAFSYFLVNIIFSVKDINFFSSTLQ